MKMRTRYLSLVMTAVALPSLVLAGQDKGPDNYGAKPLRPSEHSVVVIPDEGGVTCNKLAANGLVKQMKEKIRCRSGEGEEDGVYDLMGWEESGMVIESEVSGDGEQANYTYNCATGELSFSDATVGINAVITAGKQRRGGRGEESFYYEGEGGGGNTNINRYFYSSPRIADSMITNQNPRTGKKKRINEFSLCFGLPSSTDDQPLPRCDIEGGNAWVGPIDCGEVADGTVVTLWQPQVTPDGEEGVNIDDRVYQCVCGDVTTAACDPTGDGGALPPCYTKENGQPKATTTVEFDADPVTCTTSGGTRRCKCVDNPFLPGNDCG
jgi:hypothetical protein